jgi:glycine/D-amino acid oxidase-like deaminating enzyme
VGSGEIADIVVVGGGAIGGWAAYFARSTDLADVSGFGLDRFDEHGRSRAADAVAWPFPSFVDDEGAAA